MNPILSCNGKGESSLMDSEKTNMTNGTGPKIEHREHRIKATLEQLRIHWRPWKYERDHWNAAKRIPKQSQCE